MLNIFNIKNTENSYAYFKQQTLKVKEMVQQAKRKSWEDFQEKNGAHERKFILQKVKISQEVTYIQAQTNESKILKHYYRQR